MTLDILISVLAVLVMANYRFRRSVLYPPFLFCGMWLLDGIIYRLDLIEIYPLHSKTLYVIAIGAILFTFGGYLAFLIPSKFVATHFTLVGQPRIEASWLRHLIVSSMAICVCLAVRAAMQSVGAAGGVDGFFFAAARTAAIEDLNAGRGSFSWYSYVGTWTIFAAALFQSERNDRVSWIITAIAFVACLLSGGRTGLLSLFSAVTCIYLIRKRRENLAAALRLARWPILGFVALFGGMIFVNKNVQVIGTSAFAFAEQALVAYIVGPVAALDHVIQHPLEYTGLPNHTFQFFLRIGSSLGLVSYNPPPTLDAWIFVPFGTNVYTGYKFLITDFGIGASLTIMGIIGFLHSLLFRKAHTSSVLGLYVFSLTMYSVLMVIFDDAYSRFGLYFNAFVFAVAYLTIKSFLWHIFRYKASYKPDARFI